MFFAKYIIDFNQKFSKQNNLVDAAWFGRENVFNTESDKTWIATTEKIAFPSDSGKTWQDYVSENRLEITCGEAPYLVSRYDTVTGERIDTARRIGLLDRKLRIVNENVDSEPEWMHWAEIAFQSTYGFEWQGDNVLLARENLLLSFIDYEQLFDSSVNKIYLPVLCLIITDNYLFFQNIFEGITEEEANKHFQIINQARRCPSHAYPDNAENWSDNDFYEYRNTMAWLEPILKQYD